MSRSLTIWTVLSLLSFASLSSVIGQEMETTTALDFTNLPDGQYHVIKSGSSLLVRNLNLVKPNTPPNPPEPPNPNELTERSRKVKEACSSVSDPDLKVASKYASLLRELAKQDISNIEKLQFAVKTGGDLLLDEKWKPIRDILNAEWILLVKTGGEIDDYKQLLVEVAIGVEVGFDLEPQLDLKEILRILMVILELIDKLFPD